jgi:hypothetical protein
MPLIDDQEDLVVEYGFMVTTNPWQIELTGETVLRLQQWGRAKRGRP